mmetsp:Transcript_41008/g.68660  ORF Transcript_41008/g.68660 Transcript_41008/m.68660 type:complete len:488 (-) Transcript_41008:449-1912(-)
MWYLCYFLHRHLDFRREEAQALADTAGCGDLIEWKLPHGGSPDSPFWYINVPNEDFAKKLVASSILIKGLYEVWGEGDTFEEMLAEVQNYPIDKKQPYYSESITFKLVMEGFGTKLNSVMQKDLLKKLACIPFEGKVDLKNPQHLFRLLYTENPIKNDDMPTIVPPRWYFGREVCTGDRSCVPHYELPRRSYIGPTSMDAELSLLMCNMAGVRKGSLVYDPFVGTGSILVAAAHFGAVTWGADIDIRIIRDGRTREGKHRNVWSNFKQYGLMEPVGLLRYDAHRPPLRPGLEELFDVILCAPPYGVRAGGRKSGGRKAEKGIPNKPIPDDMRATHIPSTAPYGLTECLYDLIQFAATFLVVGGRIALWMPCASDVYTDGDVPTHPALKLIANSEQVLGRRWSRRLITLEKHRPFDRASPLEIPTVECPALLLALENPDAETEDGASPTVRDAVMPAEKRPKRERKGDGGSANNQETRRLPMYRNKNC